MLRESNFSPPSTYPVAHFNDAMVRRLQEPRNVQPLFETSLPPTNPRTDELREAVGAMANLVLNGMQLPLPQNLETLLRNAADRTQILTRTKIAVCFSGYELPAQQEAIGWLNILDGLYDGDLVQ